MNYRVLPGIFILAMFLALSCSDNNKNSDIIASINDEKKITFTELSAYHSSRFFERRFPNADLKAYPMALEEMALREKKIIDFFEQGFHQDSLLMLDMQRTINEELVGLYFEEVFFEEYLNTREVNGSPDQLRNRFLDRALIAFDRKKEELIPDEHVDWNREALIQLAEWAAEDDFFNAESPRYRYILSQSVEDGYNPVILTYNGNSVDVETYHKLLNEVLIPAGYSSPTEDQIKDYLLDAIRTYEIIQLAKEQNLHESILSKNTSNSLIRSQIISLYNRKMIHDRIPEITRENLMQFYEQEKNGELYQLAKRTLHVSLFEDENIANQRWNEIEEGYSFEQITNRNWLVKTFIKNREGEILSYLSNEEPYLGEYAFELEQGDVSGPHLVNVPGQGERYAIIRCSASNDAGIPEFNEISNIEGLFTEFHRKKYSESVEEYLTDTYNFSVDEVKLRSKLQL